MLFALLGDDSVDAITCAGRAVVRMSSLPDSDDGGPCSKLDVAGMVEMVEQMGACRSSDEYGVEWELCGVAILELVFEPPSFSNSESLNESGLMSLSKSSCNVHVELLRELSKPDRDLTPLMYDDDVPLELLLLNFASKRRVAR